MANLNIKYVAPDLQRVEIGGKRHYVTEGGTYPSVTTVLSHYKEASLLKWKQRVGLDEAAKISQKAADFGTIMHKMCESYILNEEMPEHNMFHAERFKGLKKVIDNSISDVYAIEASLWSDKLKLAGQLDLNGVFEGVNSIIDFKNSNKPKKREWIDNYFMQGAAYSCMWVERTKDRDTAPRQIVIINSVEHEDEPQIFIEPVAKWIGPLVKVIESYYNRSN